MIDIKSIKQEIEKQNPLIMNLTNSVTTNIIANALLALGASPIMTEDKDDALELLEICHAVQINIGTINPILHEIMLAVAKKNNKQKPLILDPVGCGSTTIRTQISRELLPYCTVLRGNTGEIIAVSNDLVKSTKGVDSIIAAGDDLSLMTAQGLSEYYQIPISISGAEDFVCSPTEILHSNFGTPIMSKVTGMGCTLTAIIAAFNTVISDPYQASNTAIMFYNLCGEIAFKKSSNPIAFQNYFIDTLYSPDYNYIQSKINTKITKEL